MHLLFSCLSFFLLSYIFVPILCSFCVFTFSWFSFSLFFNLPLPNSSFLHPSGAVSLEWRTVWTDWTMQSLSWGTMPWVPPPLCPVTFTVCCRTGRLDQTFLPRHWVQVGLQQWYVNQWGFCASVCSSMILKIQLTESSDTFPELAHIMSIKARHFPLKNSFIYTDLFSTSVS